MKRVALVIGHSEKSQGASNKTTGLTEWVFNESLANDIIKCISNIDIIKVYRETTYGALPSEINKLNPDLVISMHCNAFNQKASGTETLYYYSSVKGKEYAEVFNKHVVKALGLPDRGCRPRTSENRGGHILKNTKAPCLIIEPFFIDNNNDLMVVNNKSVELVQAYVNAIIEIHNLM